MPTNPNITSLKQKIQASLQPVLQKVNRFSLKFRQTFKKYLPATIIILVLVIGLAMGKRIASFFNQSINIPKPATLPTTSTLSEDSNLIPLKQSIEQFNPQLPDLLMPELNDSISLQELED